MMGEPSDGELIDGYLDTGSLDFLDRLFARHIERVRNLIGPMVRNPADADDLTQQTFIRATRGLSSFGGRAAFTTWLHRIAINTTYTFLKRQGKTGSLPLLTELAAPAYHAPDESLAIRERMAAVEAAMASLPVTWQAALVMIVVEEIPAREAAASAGVTVATMHWRVHRARKALQEALDRQAD